MSNNFKEAVIKPYYQDEHYGITIYHGDCREILPELPKVDLVLTDPPYGLNFPYYSYIDTEESLMDIIKNIIPLIIEHGNIAAISTGITNLQKYPPARWAMACVWDTTGSRGLAGFNQWFPILVYGKEISGGFGNINGSIKSDVISVTGGGSVGFQRNGLEKEHTCPKPFNLMKGIVNRLSFKGNVVLDPFMGSGTTILASKELNRKAIGIEIEEKYCEIAVKRLQQSVFEF